jgi:peptidyl-prolyl cis-trans isomerase B (cyclophilin B)
MAHAGKNTGGSQFFLCHGAQPHLDGVHTVFGKTADLDVVMAIRKGTRITKVTIQA